MHYFSRAPSLPPATPSEPRPLAPEESKSMIVNSFGQIAPQTVHDHEVPEGRHDKRPRPRPDRYGGAVTTQVIVLNGGSSSGKSGIARCLQAILPDPWLTFGTDNLIQAMPMSLQTSAAGIEFAQDGEVIVGPEFRTLEAAWIAGIAAMANARARIIVDEVFVGGAASQLRWKNALGTLQVLWVAVRCDATVAAGRELARGDRIIGMAASQAELVHRGIVY